MAGRGVKVHQKYVVLWAKHLQMGPTKIIWGPQKSSSCLPPLQSGASSLAKHGVAYFSAVYGSIEDPVAAPGPCKPQVC